MIDTHEGTKDHEVLQAMPRHEFSNRLSGTLLPRRYQDLAERTAGPGPYAKPPFAPWWCRPWRLRASLCLGSCQGAGMLLPSCPASIRCRPRQPRITCTRMARTGWLRGPCRTTGPGSSGGGEPASLSSMVISITDLEAARPSAGGHRRKNVSVAGCPSARFFDAIAARVGAAVAGRTGRRLQPIPGSTVALPDGSSPVTCCSTATAASSPGPASAPR